MLGVPLREVLSERTAPYRETGERRSVDSLTR
jgi:hypothetical protein